MLMVGQLNSGDVTLSVMSFLLIIFGLGTIISVARKAVTWIDATLMIGFGLLLGLRFGTMVTG